MKKFLPILATCLTLSSVPASAIVGGPWDGNNFNQVNQGTYQATITMLNGVGMARFTDHQDAAQFAFVNQSIIFYQGVVYLGGAFGSVDWINYEVTGITNGESISDVAAGGVGRNDFVDSGEGGNIQYCNTSVLCKMTEQAPVMRFSGSGVANFFGPHNTFDSTTTTTTTITEGDTTTVIEVIENSTGGGDPDFESVGASTKLYVYGAQISSATNVQLPVASGAGAGGVGGTAVSVGGEGG